MTCAEAKRAEKCKDCGLGTHGPEMCMPSFVRCMSLTTPTTSVSSTMSTSPSTTRTSSATTSLSSSQTSSATTSQSTTPSSTITSSPTFSETSTRTTTATSTVSTTPVAIALHCQLLGDVTYIYFEDKLSVMYSTTRRLFIT
eukprot:m.1260 g.1260  ORF g.1260 m.1260 type:complete len:142 (-) comp1294_c0_seq1:3-428(-)